MFQIQNSPEFEAQMEAHRKERERKKSASARLLKKAIDAGHGKDWTPMDKCPLSALELFDGCCHDKFLVTDGKAVTVVSVSRRFAKPVFWKTQPTYVISDGMPCLVGGEEDPRPDLPKWWWKYELKDELESEQQYYDSSSKPEVDFVPTHWMWLPKPPSPRSPSSSD